MCSTRVTEAFHLILAHQPAIADVISVKLAFHHPPQGLRSTLQLAEYHICLCFYIGARLATSQGSPSRTEHSGLASQPRSGTKNDRVIRAAVA
jgi:hypothetical protein